MQSRTSIKYLFKYVNKGHDCVCISLQQAKNANKLTWQIDEIKAYYDCKHVSTFEAFWWMFGFDIHYGKPPIERLKPHVLDEQYIVVNDKYSIE